MKMNNDIDIFGNTDPKKMPNHFFYGAVKIKYETAVKANTDKQNYSVCPREWYADAQFTCDVCKDDFIWTASEQKAWFEDYNFWVDSIPKNCAICRKEKRNFKKTKQEYDRLVNKARSSKNSEIKKKVINLINQMESYLKLPENIIETRKYLTKQIEKAEQITELDVKK